MQLTDPQTIKQILAGAGVSPKKSLGQNFLICEEVVEATLAGIEGGSQQITELGAGLGALTQALATSGYLVKAIEKDDLFVDLLPKHIPKNVRENVQVVHQDLKEADWKWDSSYQIVGNIPYNVSGLIIRRVTDLEPYPERVILLVQREVALRLCADVPDLSLITLRVQLWGGAHFLMNVPASCFWPAPKVDSALVVLEPNSELSVCDQNKVMDIARPFFQQKRKQVGGVLRKAFEFSEERATQLLSDCDIDPTARPESIDCKRWIALAEHIKQ